MAAVTTHREDDVAPDGSSDDDRPDVDLGALSRPPPLASMHAEQLRTVWIRRTLEDALRRVSYRIVDGAAIDKDGADRYRLYFQIEGRLPLDVVPWMPAALSFDGTAMIGEAAKMGCPTWDLPAGAPVFGGSCPGATPGQSTVPERVRRSTERNIGQRARLEETICESCYATGGNYASPHVQAGEILRLWWCQTVDRETFVSTLVRAIQGEQFPLERLTDPLTGEPVLPFRVHSSGDFFSVEYAERWLEVARRVPRVRFWAPTRTWAGGAGFMRFWQEAQIPPNFVVRPSAYHTDDPAPSPRAGETPCRTRGGALEPRPNQPWPGAYGFNSEGTTSIYARENLGEAEDGRYDWNCKTYNNVGRNAKTCRLALAPDGGIGCRACWLRPDLRVNFTTH